MIHARLIRYGSIPDQGTPGKLILPGFSCVTWEREWLNNQPNISCIPFGVYTCAITDSPHFGRVYQVLEVEHRTHILIHVANVQAELKGCIALGQRFGCLRTPATGSETKWGMVHSGATLKGFMAYTGGESFSLSIERDI